MLMIRVRTALSERLGSRRRGEAGLTMIELMVSLAAGMVVFGAITSLMLMTIRQTGRVTSHVEANQRARVTMTKIVNQLNSACYFPTVTPILGGSSGTKLVFVHQTGSAVAPTPIRTEVELKGTELVQRDVNPTAGSGKSWTFPLAGSGTAVQLMKGVAPLETSGPIFSYYTYSAGKLSTTPLTVPSGGLTESSAASTVFVTVGFQAAPEPPISQDSGSATAIRNSVLLRLTPPSPNSSSDNPPCQ